MTVTVVTDSGAALPPAVASELGIGVVPLRIIAGDRTYDDGEVTAEALEYPDGGVTSAAPTPGAFLAALAAADAAVIVTVGSSFSAAFGSARLAAASADIPVRVVDSRSAAGGQALAAVAAARAARAGGGLDEAEKAATAVADQVRLVAGVGDLTMLRRSGRIPALAGPALDRLGLQPMFELSGGHIRRLFPTTSRQRMVGRIIRRSMRSRPASGSLHCTALHAGDVATAERLLAGVTATVEPATAFVSGFGPAMVLHTGSSIVGLAWYWDMV